ncbi:ATP-binding cassette sub-family C member 4-like isoform X1 [Diorhabda sublineata]|uniref:ATP-binding cassette sub-family C member 4-like isoform X1 n=2 Tax=Diorhabda sublineata TaxID=1163346 RepID=UPI0024E0A671|nr:ATP-binding cassette sub-family C member 4-like isoform X1 [Diorhabda sublineata]XP_056644025.1 ATP-binding cassette sub-family C member 4-like isoform X1 [Diorhabda sublineata]
MEEISNNVKPKKKNPLDRANTISSVFFCWLLPLFVKGYKTDLTEDDIYKQRNSHESGKLGNKLEHKWKQQLTQKHPSLIKASAATFVGEFIVINIIIIISEVVRISQPFLITQLIKVYEANRANEDKNEVYMYAAMIVITSFVSTNMQHNFNLRLMQLGMKMRVACCSLIYRKALKLSKTALVETTIGQMVNLLSNDVARFDMGIYFFHNIYIGPIEILIVMYLLYTNVGVPALAGTLLLVSFIPFQSWLGKKTSQFRLQTANRTDERVRLMNEIISGIQVIKMYTWEYPFTKLVEYARMKEMKYIRYTSVIRSILMSCILMLNRCAIAISILVYVITGNTLTATYAYTVTSYYRLLYTVTNFLPTAISLAAEMYVSSKRVEKFLMYDEVKSEYVSFFEKNTLVSENGIKPSLELKPIHKDIGVFIKNASAKWLKSMTENNLEDLTMEARPGNVVAIVGPVGSGKTTLLHVILKELELEAGTVDVQGIISYASQEPWLFGGSIRQNILFGETFEQKKYDEVVRVCALQRDFALLPHGDRTLAGDRGVSLSGGQKARINLARAVYKDADIYLLDDPLSAVDAHVGKQLFDGCIQGHLKSKCVILVTHQLQYLKKLKNIYLMKDGKIEISGSYKDLKSASTNYSKLLTDIEEEEEENRKLSRTFSTKEIVNDDIQVLQKEDQSTGKIDGRVYKSYIKAGGNFFSAVLLAAVFVFSQVLDSSTEYFVTYWVNIQQLDSNKTNLVSANISQEISNQSIDTRTKQDNIYENWWLTPLFTSELTAVYYAILVIILLVIVLSRSLSFYRWALKASTTMHNKMFVNIVYSPMRFFNINPSGRILNRFSKDIGTLDESLPMSILDTVQIGLYVASTCLVIGSLTLWILIPTILIAVLFYIMRVIFVETSRDVKRIESVTRSPIFTHLSASLQGLTTIRAFQAQDILKKEFDNFQNINTSAYFLFVGANRTFGFWLDFVCVIYIALVLAALLFIKSEQFGGNMGLALTQAMALTGMFQWGMRQWSEFENQMTSVERVQEYADLKQEQDYPNNIPAKSWPGKGKIEFVNTSLRYGPQDPFVLKNLNFVINPKEKIGIVGRTGAGKTSLIQALFRLAEIDGKIEIDGIDSKTIALKELRSKISIIPQEPVLFSGTLRKNLDPFDEYNDDILWNALEEVELKHAVEELPCGLDSKMAEGGSNFSVGQRQLLCLARAIIRNNKILVLDEATANVDPHTDGLIQKTIRNKFADCTVLTIAHRLHTIMDSDRVLVMDAGSCVEFDHPYTLLLNKFGVFHSLVMKTGKATAKSLIAIAEQNKNDKELSI